jgi:hypothetical protein
MAKMLTKGLMINVPITVKDIVRAEMLYGPDMASLKGKTYNRKVISPKATYVPRSMIRTQDMYSDIFHWRGQGFLISIAMPLRIMFIDALTKSETRGYLKSILEVHIGKLSDRGFVVRTIFVDPQRALEALDGSLNVPVDVTGARRHVGVIERNIRTIKERMRAVECGLPYKCPQRLVRGLAKFVVSRLNLFPHSLQKDYVSPRELYTGIKPDFSKDVKGLSFGDYGQAH